MSAARDVDVCGIHEYLDTRVSRLEVKVEKFEGFLAWWDREKVGDKVTRAYNLLIGLAFLQGALVVAGIVAGIMKGLW